jgi:transposase
MPNRKTSDGKHESLQASRTLNPHPETVSDAEFGSSEFFDPRDLVQVKYEMIRRVRRDGASVAGAAASFGLSRQTYYQAAAALARGGLADLLPGKPGPRGRHKLTDEVLKYLEQFRQADPAVNATALAAAVAERFGLRLHPRSIERALTRASGEPDRSRKSP